MFEFHLYFTSGASEITESSKHKVFPIAYNKKGLRKPYSDSGTLERQKNTLEIGTWG